MLEFFSKELEDFKLREYNNLTPIPAEEELSSLSAILLDEDYYKLLLNQKQDQQNLSFANTKSLLIFKAKAFLDLRERKSHGEKIDSKKIKKHKNDFFRLTQLLTEEDKIPISENIIRDLKTFIDIVKREPVDLYSINMKEYRFDEIINLVEKIFIK